MLSRHLLKRFQDLSKIVSMQRTLPCYFSLFKPSKFAEDDENQLHFMKKDMERMVMKEGQTDNSHLNLQIVHLCSNIVKTSEQPLKQQLVHIQLIIAQIKKHNLANDLKKYEGLKEAMNSLNFQTIEDLQMEELKHLAQFYILVIETEVIRPKIKYEDSIFKAFLSKTEPNLFSDLTFLQLSQFYLLLTRFHLVSEQMQQRIPRYFLQDIFSSNQHNLQLKCLLNMLEGISYRPGLFQNERKLLFQILKQLQNLYETLAPKLRVRVIVQLLKIDPKNRFCVNIVAQDNLINKFISDLYSKKFNIWSESIYLFLKYNQFLSKQLHAVTEFVVGNALQFIDKDGNLLANSLNSAAIFQILVDYSKKYKFSGLSEFFQQPKLIKFILNELNTESANNELLQRLFTSIVSNQFFQDKKILPGMLQQLQIQMIPQMLYVFSIKGIKLNVEQFQQITPKQRQLVVSCDRQAVVKEIYICAAVGLQMQLVTQDQYNYQKMYTARKQALKEVSCTKSCQFVNTIASLPKHILSKLQTSMGLKTMLLQMPLDQILANYSVTDNFFINLFYLQVGTNINLNGQPLVAYVDDQSIFHILRKLLKQTNLQTVSAIFLSLLNNYLKASFSSNKNSIIFKYNVQFILTYLTQLTKIFSLSLDKHAHCLYYHIFWETIHTLIVNYDHMRGHQKWMIRYKLLFDFLLRDTSCHFFKTDDYKWFLRQSLSLVSKLKSTQITDRIILVNLVYGNINRSNHKESSELKLLKHIPSQIKQMMLMWQTDDVNKMTEIKSLNLKLMNQFKLYSHDQLKELRRSIRMIKSINMFVKLLTCYQLQPIKQYNQLYADLLIQFIKKKQVINYVKLDIIPVLKNIWKYQVKSIVTLNDSKKKLFHNWLKEIINYHFQEYSQFVLSYHAAVVRYMGLNGERIAEYEQLILKQALGETSIVSSRIRVIQSLKDIGCQFAPNYLQLIYERVLKISNLQNIGYFKGHEDKDRHSRPYYVFFFQLRTGYLSSFNQIWNISQSTFNRDRFPEYIGPQEEKTYIFVLDKELIIFVQKQTGTEAEMTTFESRLVNKLNAKQSQRNRIIPIEQTYHSSITAYLSKLKIQISQREKDLLLLIDGQIMGETHQQPIPHLIVE